MRALIPQILGLALLAMPLPAQTSVNRDTAGLGIVNKAAATAGHLLYPPTYDECLTSGRPVVTRTNIYHEGWIDLNKNGRKDIYEDPTQPVDRRVNDLLSQMTLNEKTAQLATLYGYDRVLKDYLPTTNWPHAFWQDGVANIDEQLNGYPYYKKIFREPILCGRRPSTPGH